MANDTPFDPHLVPRMMAGEPTPTMPFAPARDASEPFAVHDEATANWVVRKIVEARTYAEHVREYAHRELKRAKRKEQFFLKQYGPGLEEWAQRRIREQGGRIKGVRLPAGAVGYRATPTRMAVVNDDQLLDWCRRNLPGAVVRTERVLNMLVSDYLKKTGDCPKGVDIIPGGDRFYVK